MLKADMWTSKQDWHSKRNSTLDWSQLLRHHDKLQSRYYVKRLLACLKQTEGNLGGKETRIIRMYESHAKHLDHMNIKS